MKKANHTIYFIGGLARVGKTIVSLKLIRRKHLVPISTDGIRAAMRKILIGESHVSVDQIEFHGKATFRRPGNLKQHKISFARKSKNEDDLAWIGVVGLIERYDYRNFTDILIEGIAVTPERVHKLKLKNLKIRAAFIGYNDESHLKSVLRYSKKKNDWVQTWIKEHGGDYSHVKDWIQKGILQNDVRRKQARGYGYGYFDITERPFNEHVRIVLRYLSSGVLKK